MFEVMESAVLRATGDCGVDNVGLGEASVDAWLADLCICNNTMLLVGTVQLFIMAAYGIAAGKLRC